MEKKWPLDVTVSFDPYFGEPDRDGIQGAEVLPDGKVHFRIIAKDAKEVVIDRFGTIFPLSPAGDGAWEGTFDMGTGFLYFFLKVDGADVLCPYLPIGYGCCRPMNFVDVLHAFQVVPAFHIGHGHVHKVHRAAAAVSDGQVGAQHVRAIHLQEEIQETGSHIKGAFPGAIFHFGKLEDGSKPVNHNLFRVLCDNPEMHLSVRQDLRALDAVPARFTKIRIKRNGHVQRPFLFHGKSLLMLLSFRFAVQICTDNLLLLLYSNSPCFVNAGNICIEFIIHNS